MDVLLDLWGVLLDSGRMTPAYRARIAILLAARHGGSPETWARAHDLASGWYAAHLDRPETWERRTWIEVVDSADAEHLIRVFRGAGVEPPPDPLAAARSLEREAMSEIDAAFPDTRPAVARLKRMGHRLFVATNATESNARGSLAGANLLGAFDGVFTGERLATGKATPAYWRAVRGNLGGGPVPPTLVDDRLDYLEPAASVGIVALLLDRNGAHRPEAMPTFVQATLRNLAGLPHWVEARTGSTPA